MDADIYMVLFWPPLLAHDLYLNFQLFKAALVFLGGSESKESACSTADAGSVPELGRFPGGGQVFHSSILPGEFHELFHVVTKIQTQLNDFYDDENMD